MDEESAVLVGYRRGSLWYGRLRQRQVGTPSCVAFDWGWVLGREERYGDVIGFYHTHPPSHERPSTRDVRTMRAWVSSFGKPLLCVIESQGALTATVFCSDDDGGELLGEVQRFPRSVIVGVDGWTRAAGTESTDIAIEEA
jgi:proteasome lid subunit RPN8/RPN11